MHTFLTNSESFLNSKDIVRTLENHQAGFFSSVAWYKNFIDTVIKKDGDRCIFIQENNNEQQSTLILPLKVSAGKSKPSISSLTNYYSPIFNIFSNKLEIAALKKIVSELSNLNWSSIELRPFSYENAFLLRKALLKLKIPSVPFFCFGNWYLPVNGSTFDEYFSKLSSQVQNTVNRKSKKFNKLPNTRTEILTSTTDLDKAAEVFENVYNSSWKQPEPYPDFIPGLMKIAAEQGSLRVGVAYLDEAPIASQLWIVADNTAYIFKLAYNEAYKQHSAGTVLTALLMRHVIDNDKVDFIDYLCGDDDYKKDWMSHRRERWGLLIFNIFSFQGVLLFCKEMPKYWLKSLVSFLKK